MGRNTYGYSLLAVLLAAVLGVITVAGAPAPARAQYQEEAEELILAVLVPPYMLSDGIITLQKDNRNYLPVIELAEAFSFVIEPELERGYVSGYFINPENSYEIDLEEGYYAVRGKRHDLPATPSLDSPYEDERTELYILDEVLNKIWPVEMTVNLSGLALQVEPEESLPFQRRLERRERQEMFEAREELKQVGPKVELPFIPNPHKIFGLPTLDIQSDLTWDSADDERIGSTVITGVQDLAGMTADYSARLPYRQKKFRQAEGVRLRLSRESYDDEPIVLDFDKVELADVRLQQRELIDSGVSGRGVLLSAGTRKHDREFDEVTIEGIGVAGWEVELYRNNTLIDFGEVDEDGEYRFENVPLEAGNNQIRIVLYGPQGQIEERVESHSIGGGMLPPGEVQYFIGAVDADRDMFELDDEPRTTPRGIAANTFMAYGLNNNLTMFGSLSRLPTTESVQSYSSLGMAGALGNLLAQAELYKNIGGGSVLDTRFATRVKGVNLNLQSAFYRDFESPDAGFGANIKTYEGELRANTNIKTFLGSLGIQLTGKHLERKNSMPSSQLTSRLSLGRSGLRLTHQTTSTYVDYVHQSSSARANATYRRKNWQFRGQAGYNIYPLFEVSSVGGDVRYKQKDGLSVAVSANHNFLNDGSSAGIQVGYDFKRLLASVDYDWMKDNGSTILLRASTSFGPYGQDGSYIFSSDKMTRQSPLQAYVFLDNDGDMVFTPDIDEPLEDAGILIDRRHSKDNTDENGVLVERAGAAALANVTVNESTLIDPYYKPASPGYEVLLRPGSMQYLSFPVTQTGAIDGIAYYDSGENVEGLGLQLVDAQGAVVMETETAYDGFYAFEYVPAGSYVVRPDPEYGLDVEPVPADVTMDELFLYGVDLTLEGGKAPAAEEEDDEMSLTDEDAEAGDESELFDEMQDAPENMEGVPADDQDTGFESDMEEGVYESYE